MIAFTSLISRWPSTIRHWRLILWARRYRRRMCRPVLLFLRFSGLRSSRINLHKIVLLVLVLLHRQKRLESATVTLDDHNTHISHIPQGDTSQVPLFRTEGRIREDLLRCVPNNSLYLELGAFPQCPDALLGGLLLEFAQRFGRETGMFRLLQLVEDGFELERGTQSGYAIVSIDSMMGLRGVIGPSRVGDGVEGVFGAVEPAEGREL